MERVTKRGPGDVAGYRNVNPLLRPWLEQLQRCILPRRFFCRRAEVFRAEGGVMVYGDAALHSFWCYFAVLFILAYSIAVSKH